MITQFKNKKLLLAVSGGIDSIYMYHSLLKSCDLNSIQIGLAHVNYNTSSNSIKSMELCRALSQKNNHAFYFKNVKLNTESNFENNARVLRYSFFNSIMKREEYDYILTAHNKNDLIETLYMQNVDVGDYSSIPFNQQNNCILRPLINKSRSDIFSKVKRFGYKYYEDPTNSDLRYKRNHVRHKELPALNNKDIKIKELLNIHFNKVKLYNTFLHDYKEQKNNIITKKINSIEIDRKYLKSVDLYGFKLILQGIIKKECGQFIKKTTKYWRNLHFLVKSNKTDIYQIISEEISILIQNDKLLISSKYKTEVCKRIGNNTKWMNYRFNVSSYKKSGNNKDVNTFICPRSIYKDGLYIRKWMHGDKYIILNNKSKNISTLFNEKKIERTLRSNYPIIFNKDRVEWIPGLAHSQNNYLKSDKLLSITAER